MKNLFKYTSLLVAAAMFFACEGTVDNGEDGGDTGSVLKLTADKNLIQTFGGDFATLSVTLDGEPVKEGVVFFDGNSNILEIDGFKFKAETPGEYQIIASYGTYLSEAVSVKAVSVALPETLADPNPGSTEFKARMLVTEVTTTGCGYCPGMKSILHPALEDESIAEKVVFTSCHNGIIGVADPAYVHTTYADFDPPYLYCDMYAGFGYFQTWGAGDVISLLNKIYGQKQNGAAGIAVSSSLADGQLVAKVTVKPSVTGDYRVGAFLLEDGVYGKQTGTGVQDWMSTHNSVIRYVDSRYYTTSGEKFYGHSIGKINAGETSDYVFVWMLDDIWTAGSEKGDIYGGTPWAPFVEEKLHLAVFVSTIGKDEKGNEIYYVNNVVDCPANGKKPFEYR